MDCLGKRLNCPFNETIIPQSKYSKDVDWSEDDDNEDESSNFDRDTVPDEEFRRNSTLRGKLTSWPNNKDTSADPKNLNILTEGPNINLKMPRRSYSSREEKDYFFNKIKSKQKTELCKNWSLYSACYFKNNCSFAHGDRELRHSLLNTEKYKTKICKMFKEDFYCNYGNRCIYLHVIKERRLFNYNYILKQTLEEYLIEFSKSENLGKDIIKIVNTLKQKKQYITPRLSIFEHFCAGSISDM